MVNYDNKRWLKILFTFKGSVIKEITPKVVIFTLNAMIITFFYHKMNNIKISTAPFTIIGGALGFLLVFRTNTSYDRYWEGRKLWGELTNQTRNLAIKIENYCINNKDKAKEIMNLHNAFLNLVKMTIRDEKDYGSVEKFMNKDLFEKIKKHKRPHIVIAAIISYKIMELKKSKIIDEIEHMLISQNMDTIMNATGGIERIRRTPIPIAYALHLKRVLYIFSFLLPLAFVDTIGWWTVPVVTFISYVFLGIEEIGVEIEDPFGEDANDLPIDDICINLEGNIEDIENILKN